MRSQLVLALAIGTLLFALLFVLAGCTVMPDKLLVGEDHTSHILQHFEHEGDGGTVGCTGVMAALRWERGPWYVQASDSYCLIGTNDNQREVANLQSGIAISLK